MDAEHDGLDPEGSPPTDTGDAASFWPELTPDEAKTLDNETLVITERRVRVSKLYRRGRTMREIATDVGCSLGTVHSDLRAVFDGWKRMAVREHAERVADALSQLADLESQIAADWQASRGPEPDPNDPPKKPRYGDPRLAGHLLNCFTKRCMLFGLLRPEDFKKLDQVPACKLVAGVDPQEVV